MTDNDSTRDTSGRQPDPGSGSTGGDDERESRESIERTGEPNRDESGNQDGAS